MRVRGDCEEVVRIDRIADHVQSRKWALRKRVDEAPGSCRVPAKGPRDCRSRKQHSTYRALEETVKAAMSMDPDSKTGSPVLQVVLHGKSPDRVKA